MSEINPGVILSPADFADTGQWRLMIYITHTGMEAYLQHVADETRPLVRLFAESREGEPGAAMSDSTLLVDIEKMIYSHPSLLDDYATEIVVETPLVAWMPAEYLRDADEVREECVFTRIYPSSVGEVMTERVGELEAIYSFAEGFEGFMARTLPGARMRCHQGVLVENLARRSGNHEFRIYVDYHGGLADMLLFRGEAMLSAATSAYASEAELSAAITNILDLYGIAPAEVELRMAGDAESCESVMLMLEERCGSREMLRLPALTAGSGLPLAIELLIERNQQAMTEDSAEASNDN